MNRPVLILYLEDNPRDVELVRHQLLQTGLKCELRIAIDRVEYEAALAQTKFDLILSDYSLPNYDGMSALAFARACQPEVPFILVSGSLGEEQAVDCMLRGATDYVLKQRLDRLGPAVVRAVKEFANQQKRREAEAALLATQQMNEIIINALSARVFWKDQNLVYLGCNAIFARDAGFAEAHDIIGKDDFQMGWREQAEKYRADDQQVIASGQPRLNREEIQTTPAGNISTLLTSKLPLHAANGAVNGVLGTYLDISALKQAEAEIRLQGNALRAAANTIVITDRVGNVVWANPAFTKLTGYPVSEVLGKNPRVLKSGQHDAAFYRQLWETIQAGKVWAGEIVNRRKDGSLYTEEMTITPVRSEPDAITHFIAVKQDITARKQVEHALQASNRQLVEAAAELGAVQRQVVQQESLRALGQMASGMAHDFNNALSPIIGFSELLLKFPKKLADREESTRFLRLINTAGLDAAEVVRRLREFGRQHLDGEISKAVDLVELIRQTIELTQPRWKDQSQAVGVTIQVATDLNPVPSIQCEESAIRELMMNLIFNAVDALPTGGTITLGTAVDGKFVRFWVTDNGTGMTEEVRQRCFEPFYTTKEDQGTGLGLSMVHGIVKRHSGTVEIRSELGHGTTFTIRLPIGQSTVAGADQTGSWVAQKLHVLVVDDDSRVREVVEAWLTVEGHSVAMAENGAAALQQLAASRFDLVITDKAMPNMNGEQLSEAIRAIDPNLPIILMTGFGDLMKAAGKLPPQIRTILSKPITETNLREALSKVFPAGKISRQKIPLKNPLSKM